jgi:hypothetical protein
MRLHKGAVRLEESCGWVVTPSPLCPDVHLFTLAKKKDTTISQMTSLVMALKACMEKQETLP